MRYNPRQPSQVAGDNPAGRTRNRIRQNRAQNPNVLNISGQPQASKPGPSTAVGPPAPSANVVRRALAVPTTVASIASAASFMQITARESSPRCDRREEDANIADDTIRSASPAGSARLSHREPEQAQSVDGSEPDLEQIANLDDRRLTFQRNSPSRSTTRNRDNSDEQAELPESERRKQSAEWKTFHSKKIAEVHSTERQVAGLTEETEAAMANLEKIKAQTRQEEARMEQLRAKTEEKEEEEQRDEVERRAYDETTRRWENRRKEIARQVALEYEQADQNQVQHPSNFQRSYALTTNQVPFPGPPMQTSVPHLFTVVPNLMPPDSAGLN